jgi:hypothetical protein
MLTFATTFANYVRGGDVANLQWLVYLYANDGTNKIYRTADIETYDSSSNWRGIVKEISGISTSIDPFDCSYSVSNVTVKLAEGELYILTPGVPYSTTQDIAATSIREYRNREIKIYMWVPGCTAALVGVNAPPLVWSGVIENYYYDKTEECWVFDAVAEGEIKHKTIPTTVVEKTNYPKAPEESVGQRIPIVYGVFYTPTINTDVTNGPLNDSFNVVPTVCTDASLGVFTAASHACKGATRARNWIYLDDLGIYGLSVQDQAGNDMTSSATGPTTYTLPTAALQYYKVANIWIPCMKTGSLNVVSDPTNIIDGIYSSGTTIVGPTEVGFTYYSCKIPRTAQYVFPLAPAVSDLRIWAYVSDLDPGTHGYECTLRLYNPYNASACNVDTFDADTWALENIRIGSFGNGGAGLTRTDIHGTAKVATAQWDWDELGMYEIIVGVNEDQTLVLNWIGIAVNEIILTTPPRGMRQERGWVRSGEGFLLRSRVPTLPAGRTYRSPNSQAVESISQIFVELTGGRMFGSWIDTAGRSNSFNENDTIYTSNFIVESILRDELGVATADIDTAAFDAAETAAYHLGFSVNNETNTKDLIQDIGFNSQTLYYQTSDKKWSLFQFPETPASSDYDFDCAVLNFTRYYWSPQSWLANDVKVYYAYDYARGKFMRYQGVSNATAQGDTVAGQNITRTLSVESPFCVYQPGTAIYTDDQAYLLATYLCAQWKDPHLIMEFDCADVSAWKVQEGDVVTFANADDTMNPMGLGGGSATDRMSTFTGPRTKYFLIIGCVRGMKSVRYTAFQLHDLS